MKTRFKPLLGAFVAFTVLFSLTGCGSGEFKAEEVPSRAALQAQIDQVNANPRIPPQAKPQIIHGLEQRMKQSKS